MATVLLWSYEPMLAEGLTAIFSQAGDFALAFCGPKADDLCSQMEQNQPDLLLIDMTSDFTSGLLSIMQNLAERTRIVLWVHSISAELALQAMSLGVRGVLRKTASIETLVRCLARVNEGELWFENVMTESIPSPRRDSLTRREGQLVALLTQGLKNKEIASALSITEGTVKVYLSRLFQKLGVNDRFELAIYGIRNVAAGGRSTGASEVSVEKATSTVMNPLHSFFVDGVPPQLRPDLSRSVAHLRA